MIPDFLVRFWQNFDSVDEKTYVGEDPNDVGYRMMREGPISPALFNKPVATEETMTILCEIAPPEFWWEVEDAATTN